MDRFFRYCHRWAPWIIGAYGVLAGFAVWQARDLKIEVSSDALIPRESPALRDYERVRATFGSDQLAIIYIHDDQLWSAERLPAPQKPDAAADAPASSREPEELNRLERLRLLSLKLRALPEIQEVDSLFTAGNIEGSFGMIDTSPVLSQVPRSQARLDQAREKALRNPLYVDNLISRDGDSMLLMLALLPEAERDGEMDSDAELSRAIDEIIAREKPFFDTIFQTGGPAVNTAMADTIASDQMLLLPFSALVVVLVIGLMLRSFQAALIPVINAALATALLFGLMAFFGVPLNLLNYIVPALILIIGATEDVHILHEYLEGRLNHQQVGAASVEYVGRNLGLTLILTGVTTTLGFAATGLNALEILQIFGLTAALAMLLRFLVSVTFLPAWLRLVGERLGGKARKERANSYSGKLCNMIMRVFVKRPYPVVLVALLICVLSVRLLPNIEVSNDFTGFLREDSPIRQQLDTVSEELAGTKILYVTLLNEAGTFKTANGLGNLAAVDAMLTRDSRTDTVNSFADQIRLIHGAMLGKKGVLPTQNNLIEQYLIMFHRSLLRPYVNGDFSVANIVIRTSLSDSQEINRLVHDIEAELATGRYGRSQTIISGKSAVVAAAVDRIILGQIWSLAAMIGLLFLMIGGLFVSIKVGLISVLTNLFPVAIVFGLMALGGVTLNVGTCMVAAITIGIAVDDTLHMMVRYHKLLQTTRDEPSAIRAALRHEIFPVTVTSLGLGGGFLVLATSSFLPVVEFGLLSAIVMLAALVSDLILTPSLLSTVRIISLWDVLGFRLRQQLLEQSPMFHGFNRWECKKLILLADVQSWAAQSRVIKDGDLGECMYVVIEGSLEVSKEVGGQTIKLNELKLGDIFGEVALVSPIRRTADVIATNRARTLVLTWESLERLQNRSPKIASKLFLNLARILGIRLDDALQRLEPGNRATAQPGGEGKEPQKF